MAHFVSHEAGVM